MADTLTDHALALLAAQGLKPRILATTHPIQQGVRAPRDEARRVQRVMCPNCQQGGAWRGKPANCPRCGGEPYGLYLWCRHGHGLYWRSRSRQHADEIVQKFIAGTACLQVDADGRRHNPRRQQ